ncbi:MAG: hypothetical protein D6808_03970 [Candidatus Dadabacteria bacterium]|nr:MAG: hypothetical protein D6808_03970 [Candidatus Dadabacteria bacterium]
MSGLTYIRIANALDQAGLRWYPEIGDEVSERMDLTKVSILVDPAGMTPNELRETYLWLPSVEQLVQQIEARQAILFHTGLELTSGSMGYKTVVQFNSGQIEAIGESVRESLGLALKELLIRGAGAPLH